MIFIMNKTVLIVLLLALAGCAPPFSKQLLEQVDRTLSFSELRKNPEQYRGKVIMLAGTIINARNTREGTVFEILQKSMDNQGRPHTDDATEGRFLVISEQFIDTAVYHRGRDITVIGEVRGQKMQQLGEIEYQYPLVAPKELHLWEPSEGPKFYFGVGISHRI